MPPTPIRITPTTTNPSNNYTPTTNKPSIPLRRLAILPIKLPLQRIVSLMQEEMIF